MIAVFKYDIWENVESTQLAGQILKWMLLHFPLLKVSILTGTYSTDDPNQLKKKKMYKKISKMYWKNINVFEQMLQTW